MRKNEAVANWGGDMIETSTPTASATPSEQHKSAADFFGRVAEREAVIRRDAIADTVIDIYEGEGGIELGYAVADALIAMGFHR